MSQAVFLGTELRYTVREKKINQFSFGILSLSEITYPFKNIWGSLCIQELRMLQVSQVDMFKDTVVTEGDLAPGHEEFTSAGGWQKIDQSLYGHDDSR